MLAKKNSELMKFKMFMAAFVGVRLKERPFYQEDMILNLVVKSGKVRMFYLRCNGTRVTFGVQPIITLLLGDGV